MLTCICCGCDLDEDEALFDENDDPWCPDCVEENFDIQRLAA